MESLALKPHLLARQAHAHTCTRSLSGLRPTRVAVTFSGRRASVPRNRTAARVAAAETEEAQQVATEEPSAPAESRQRRGQDTNGGARRRDGNQGKRRKLEQKYQISDLVVGMEVEGLVGALTAFGAFVDIGLGGKDALIHISQLSDGFVSEVDKYVQPGQTIKARIYNVDVGSNKVGLTMRTPEELQQRAERSSERSGERQDRTQAPVQARARRAPRERKEIKYPPVGEEITGRVDALTNYGVFVKVNDDLRALLHQDEVTSKDGRDPDIRAMFNVGDEIKVRVLRIDAKNRRVDLTQRSEEERASDKALTEQGARSVRVSGLNSLGAALARAGIRKQDFEDVSKAPEDGSEAASEVPAAAAPSAPTPEASPVEDEAAAAPSPAVALEQEDASDSVPESVPETPAAEEALPNTQSSPTPLDEVVPIEEASPVAEATSAAAAEEAASVPQDLEPEVFPSAAEAAPAEEAAAAVAEPEEVPAPEVPEASGEAGAAPAAEEAKAEELPEDAVPLEAVAAPADPDALEPATEAAAAPELAQAPAPEAAPAAEEPKEEALHPAQSATDASSATLGGKAAPEPAVEAAAEPAASSPAPAQAAPDSTAADSAAPFKVDAKAAKALRDQTGAGMMDAKKALMETQGDVAQAVEWLRKKGLSSADKKSGRVASEGVIASYIHAGSRLGVLVELNCETDFVARGDKFKELVSDMAMQIAACSDVSVVSVDHIPADVKQKEFDIEMGKEDIQSKPENIRPKIVEGRVAKTLNTMALLEQPFIKDTDKDVASIVKEAVSTLGENIQIRRFEKFVLGEGIEKKTNDLAKEVEAQTKAFEEAAAKKAAAAPDSDAPAAEAAAEPAQAKVDAQAVKQLRQVSGAGMMDAKKALLQTGGDVDKALEHLRKKGLASADKKAGRLASEGAIGAYIHAGSRLGVLVEVNCETDFVARGDQFKELVQDIAMQIAASPAVDIVSIDEAPQEELERERSLEMQKEDIQSKPEAIRGKIVDGRVQKIFKERALLEQAFIKDTSKTVAEHIKAQVATIGENIQVRRFARFVLGEGIEKKQEDFAAEIAAATGQA